MADLPKHARVVIIGGGVIGCSIAYHLGKLGWSDVVLIERKQLMQMRGTGAPVTKHENRVVFDAGGAQSAAVHPRLQQPQ